MGRIAFVKAESPAVQVLGELHAGHAAELQGLSAKRSQSTWFRCANGTVNDFRRAGIVETQEQPEIVEAVLFVWVGRTVQVGAFTVDDVDFAGLAEELVALLGHVGYEFLGVEI